MLFFYFWFLFFPSLFQKSSYFQLFRYVLGYYYYYYYKDTTLVHQLQTYRAAVHIHFFIKIVVKR